jgi:hypothetical protein
VPRSPLSCRFANSINIGNLAACVGGSMTYIGGGVVSAAILNAQWVYGNLMFVGEASRPSLSSRPGHCGRLMLCRV